MSESYVECLVKRESSVVLKIARIVLIMLTVVFGIIGIAGYLVALLIAVVAGVGAYFLNLQIDVEFEYLYLDKEIYVDKIMAKSKRKRIASCGIERMEIFAPINSHRLDSYRRRQGKITDYSIGKAEQPDLRYMMFYEGNQKILLSPSEELVKAIRNVAPRKVFMD